MESSQIKRLHWGCGSWRPEGWINSDIKEGPGVDLPCDILKGLPLDTGSIDYAVSICALPEMTYQSLIPVLQELRRVLKPGGVLRLGLADLDKAIAAYQRGDTQHFLVPDEEAKSLGAKLCVYLIWYGYVKLLFTRDFIEEMLLKAGFSKVAQCEFQQTASPWPEITQLDNRPNECLFVEAVK
jgi:predicted SAM-dependent methyltransferase